VSPRTSQPPPGAFQDAFTRLINEGADAILSVHLSAKLSGTYQSACTARDSLPDELKQFPIEIVDSQSVSLGMSAAIMQAAEEAHQGLELEQIKAHLLGKIARTHILFVLDTLEYLKRGGRIGAASALLGSTLNIKPILSLKDGLVGLVERPRTRSKAFERVAQLISEWGTLEQLVIVESDDEVGRQLEQALQAVYSGDIPTYKLGAVLGTYTGPNVAGVVGISAK
jgi:DegV family protein with EDD domain